MSFSAKLTFTNETKDDKNPIVVLSCSYSFFKGTDGTGQPTSRVKGGQINITVIGSARHDVLTWMLSSVGQDGKITFFQADSPDQVQKEISFKGAHCISYSEEFTSTGTMPVIEKFVLTAKEITIGDNKVENNWVDHNDGQ